MPCSLRPSHHLRLGPISPKTDLDKAVTRYGARFDQSSHGSAVAIEGSVLADTGVGMSVEVDHRDLSRTQGVGDARGVGKGDCVVAAKNDRDLVGRGDLFDSGDDPLQRKFDLARDHKDIADIHHPERRSGSIPVGRCGRYPSITP